MQLQRSYLCEKGKLQEHFSPFFYFIHRFLRYLVHTLDHLTVCPWLTQEFCLRKKLVGKTDKLFLKGFRDKILYRQIPVVLLYYFLCKSRPCVSLAHPRMTFKPNLAQKFCAQISVTQILFCTKAIDPRSIGQEDTNVMQHCSLIHKLFIKPEFRMSPCQFKSKCSNSLSMCHVNVFQFIFTRIVSVDNLFYIHCGKSCSCSQCSEDKHFCSSTQKFMHKKTGCLSVNKTF